MSDPPASARLGRLGRAKMTDSALLSAMIPVLAEAINAGATEEIIAALMNAGVA
jgi:hypothetical protein